MRKQRELEERLAREVGGLGEPETTDIEHNLGLSDTAEGIRNVDGEEGNAPGGCDEEGETDLEEET